MVTKPKRSALPVQPCRRLYFRPTSRRQIPQVKGRVQRDIVLLNSQREIRSTFANNRLRVPLSLLKLARTNVALLSQTDAYPTAQLPGRKYSQAHTTAGSMQTTSRLIRLAEIIG